MAFSSSHAVEARLASQEKLTEQDVRDMKPWMHQISEAGMRRLTAELALQNIEAVQNFEASSSTLTKWIIWLTAVLVILTIVIAYYAVVLARSEKHPAVSSLRVRNIEIVDGAGIARMRLGAPVPDPATGGKTSPRKSPLNGIQINVAKGDEFGGLGMMDDGSMTFCFDSKKSEATCMYSLVSGERGFSVTDDGGKDRAVIEIGKDKSVSLSINEQSGKPVAVIRFGIGTTPELRMMEASGKLIWSVPRPK